MNLKKLIPTYKNEKFSVVYISKLYPNESFNQLESIT